MPPLRQAAIQQQIDNPAFKIGGKKGVLKINGGNPECPHFPIFLLECPRFSRFSCATLFACVSPPGSVFERLLEKYYGGERDERTLGLLGNKSEPEA